MRVRSIALILLMTIRFVSYGFDFDNKFEVLDVYNQKLKGDSLLVASKLDSAKLAFSTANYQSAIYFADTAFELSKKFPNSDFSVQSILILARSYRDLYLKHSAQSDFNNTLRYYLKAITTLESMESKWRLPKIYKEYGDFYMQLKLEDLTVKNYEKAFDLVKESEDYEFKIDLINTLASLNYGQGKYSEAIFYYDELCKIHASLYNEKEEINTLIILTQLHREAKNYDKAIYNAKIIYDYYKRTDDPENEITYQSLIGEISYEAGNNDQADKAFKSYFSLVKKSPALLQKEIASLRYVRNLVTEGDIYAWSTENGYWSDYETALRYYNDAHKQLTDYNLNPELTCKILNRSGTIFFKKQDYKTSVTYFELALYYARKSASLEQISENHIMLARAYDAIEEWKKAFDHYELHAEYKDSILHLAARERNQVAQNLLDVEKERIKVQQTLDMIETQEIQELSVAEKELRNIKLENDLDIYQQQVALKDLQILNQNLAEDSIKRNNALIKQRYDNEEKTRKIELLNSEQARQEILLKKQESDKEIRKQQIQLLEQENTLARSQQAYYVLSIILISLILVFILAIYWQKRKANHKLKIQNEKIEFQSKKLKQAYKNLELLSTIGRDITSTLIIEEIIETVYENLNTLMDASVLGIGVYEKNDHSLLFPGVREKNQRLNDIKIDLEGSNSLAAYCFNNQEEIILDNYFESYSQYINPAQKPISGDGNSTSVVFLPLTVGDTRLGVLTVQSFYEKAFNEYHINIIRNIAIYTKIALENANFYRELEVQSENLKIANRNIGEQNKLIEQQNQQLLNINEEKNNLMKILAHDLRNPLATAMSMTELVRYEKENLSAEQYHASEIIWRGLNRMNDMIRKILDIKAVESQKVNLDFEILNANELIGPLEKLFAVKAESKQIQLHFSSDSDEPFINVDRNYTIQVMENLISNALKFSPTNKHIFVNVMEKETVVRISVKDEGPGISESDFTNLFKKYKKLSAKPTGGEQSIGLGLSIVKKYVEVMKGEVWCESEEGFGTEFIIEFKKEQVVVS